MKIISSLLIGLLGARAEKEPPMFAHDRTKKVKATFGEQALTKRQRRRENGRSKT